MTKLTTKARKAIPAGKFALPGRRYPVEDDSHARDAESRASQQYNAGRLSAGQKAKVDAAAARELGGGKKKGKKKP